MNERLFDGKAAVYAQFRPDYPDALFDHLREKGLLTETTAAADIGAGTGIFTRRLASHAGTVFAVEPNAGMRREGERNGPANVRFVEGTAEKTGLPEASADLVTAAQAFHWFDREAFRKECGRILRPGGWIALVWNRRDHSPLMQALAEVNRLYCPRFSGFSGGRSYDRELDAFFQGRFWKAAFPNETVCSQEAFIGRCLSASYAPVSNDGPYRSALSALFQQYSKGGAVRYPYVTQCFYGRIGGASGVL